MFSDAEEAELESYLVQASRIGFPLTTKAVRGLAYELAKKNQKRYPKSWDEKGLVGEDWI